MGGEDPIQAGRETRPRLHRRGDRTGAGHSGASAMRDAAGESYRNGTCERRRTGSLRRALAGGAGPSATPHKHRKPVAHAPGALHDEIKEQLHGHMIDAGSVKGRGAARSTKGVPGFRKSAMKDLRTCTTAMLRARFDSHTPGEATGH